MVAMPPHLPASRLYYLDWLRIAAFGLLVAYHVGMLYVPWYYHFKHLPSITALEPWMRLSSPWRMGLLFAVSGVATGLMLGRAGLAGERTRRLLWPLLVGVVLVVPPQSYVEVQQRFGFDGSYLAFLGLYFSGHGGFCQGQACLILPTWNHLWFLPYLWLYTMVLLGWQRFAPSTWRGRLGDALAGAGSVGLLVWPALYFALLRLTLMPWFGATHALVDDPWAHASYGAMFAFGVAASQQPGLLARLQDLRWPALCLGLTSWGVVTVVAEADNEVQRALMRGCTGLQQWCGVVAAFGFARRHLDRDHVWRAPLSEAVFPLYLWHQTIIIVGAAMLGPLAWPAGAEAAVLVVLTLAGSLLLWRVSRHAGPLKLGLGLRS
jgi:glucans biosynthesis protein C